MKKCLVVRLGAYGDMLMITPAIKKLKEMGYYVMLNTNKRGCEIFEHNPNVDEIILHDEDMPSDKLTDHWEKMKKVYKPDRFINFTESIEINVALHPIQPAYMYTKKERIELCNKNYYDTEENWAGLEGCQKFPEMYFTPEEVESAKSYLDPLKFNILWQLSGSAKQKVYPWTDYVMGEVLKNYSNVRFITTGDLKCQILETIIDPDIINLSGDIPFRLSALLTKYVDLVIAPDTGILHASGMFPTPKIGLLGHTTRENITKYFINDYSLEAICACSPCMRLIYSYDIQCPVEFISRAAWCMAEGIKPERLYERIEECIRTFRGKKDNSSDALSDMRGRD